MYPHGVFKKFIVESKANEVYFVIFTNETQSLSFAAGHPIFGSFLFC
jgi:hypothetical protein